MKIFSFHKFGELRQNFSEVADFVTIYIAEVSSFKKAKNLKVIIVASMIAPLKAKSPSPSPGSSSGERALPCWRR